MSQKKRHLSQQQVRNQTKNRTKAMHNLAAGGKGATPALSTTRANKRNAKTQELQERFDEYLAANPDSRVKMGVVISRYGKRADVMPLQVNPDTGKLEFTDQVVTCYMKAVLEDLVVGDYCYYHQIDDNDYFIIEIKDRTNLLARHYFGKMRNIVANLTTMIITSSINPDLNTEIIDRYLIVAQNNGIRPIILINKVDLIPGYQQLMARFATEDYAADITAATAEANASRVSAPAAIDTAETSTGDNLDSATPRATLANATPQLDPQDPDYVAPATVEEVQAIIDYYNSLGYTTIPVSANHQSNISYIQQAIGSEGLHIFVGQTGVGKSSLINAIFGENLLAVGEINANTRLGKHTTTTSRLLMVNPYSALIDSPGIREFSIENYTQNQIMSGYIELHEPDYQCRFSDCNHVNNLGCGITRLLEDGKIAEFRYENLMKLLASAEDA